MIVTSFPISGTPIMTSTSFFKRSSAICLRQVSRQAQSSIEHNYLKYSGASRKHMKLLNIEESQEVDRSYNIAMMSSKQAHI